jgi:hypothetical protein
MIFMSITFSSMWVYLSAHHERLVARPLRTPLQAWIRFSAGLVAYVAATLVAAFISPGLALVIYGAIGVYYLFENLPSEPEAPGSGDEQKAGAQAGS